MNGYSFPDSPEAYLKMPTVRFLGLHCAVSGEGYTDCDKEFEIRSLVDAIEEISSGNILSLLKRKFNPARDFESIYKIDVYDAMVAWLYKEFPKDSRMRREKRRKLTEIVLSLKERKVSDLSADERAYLLDFIEVCYAYLSAGERCRAFSGIMPSHPRRSVEYQGDGVLFA